MKKTKKLRTRKHAVVLNRSAGGDAGITILLVILGIFMFLPMWFTLVNSLKPLGEMSLTPPRFYVIKPTLCLRTSTRHGCLSPVISLIPFLFR